MKVKAKRPAATTRAVRKRVSNGVKSPKAKISAPKIATETEKEKKVEKKIEPVKHKKVQTAEGWKRSMMKRMKKEKA